MSKDKTIIQRCEALGECRDTAKGYEIRRYSEGWKVRNNLATGPKVVTFLENVPISYDVDNVLRYFEAKAVRNELAAYKQCIDEVHEASKALHGDNTPLYLAGLFSLKERNNWQDYVGKGEDNAAN